MKVNNKKSTQNVDSIKNLPNGSLNIPVFIESSTITISKNKTKKTKTVSKPKTTKSKKTDNKTEKVVKKASKKQKQEKHPFSKTESNNINNKHTGTKVATVFGVILGFAVLIASVIMIALMDNKEQHNSLPSIILLGSSAAIFIFTLSTFIYSIKLKDRMILNKVPNVNLKTYFRLVVANILAYTVSLVSVTLTITTYITWFVEKI